MPCAFHHMVTLYFAVMPRRGDRCNQKPLSVMKHLFQLFAFLLFSSAIPVACINAEEGGPVPTGRIHVRISGVRSQEGELGLALFNSKEGFPMKPARAFAKGAVAAEGESHVYVFEHVPYGTYAISVMHDENRNGKLDTNFIGIPREGVGASNNPVSRFGPPSFDSSSFRLDRQELDLDIRMKYL